VSAAPVLRVVRSDDDDELARLRAKVDVAALVARGYDPSTRVFAPAQDDPLFGWAPCQRVGCARGGFRDASHARGLCDYCLHFLSRWASDRGLSSSSPEVIAAFKREPLRRSRPVRAQQRCRVCRTPGHERPAHRLGLCSTCADQCRRRGQTPDDYVRGDVRFAPAQPRVGYGDCGVDGCPRLAWSGTGLCRSCDRRYTRVVPDRDPGKVAAFCGLGPWTEQHDGRTAKIPESVSELVALQLLAGLQSIIHPYGVIVPMQRLSQAWGLIATEGVASVLQIDRKPGDVGVARVLELTQRAARRLTTTPEEERTKDVWDLAVFGIGKRSRVSFEGVRQLWLRELTKDYVVMRISTTKGTANSRQLVSYVATLSEFLAGRADGGLVPEVLDRADIDGWLSWLRLRQPQAGARSRTVGMVRSVLEFAQRRRDQATGVTVGPRFLLYREDVPKRDADDLDEPGKALPPFILAQLLHADSLGLFDYDEYRLIFEIAAHTGRRPSENCGLRWDCLRHEEGEVDGGQTSGRPVLRYWREKRPSKWHTIPIHEATAEIVREQQRRVRDRFPDTPTDRLVLFPRRTANPRGVFAVPNTTMGSSVSKWLKRLPDLVLEDGTPFPKTDVYLYALRHSYAQRHADHGVPLDVLQKLMDHRSPQTTQIYYRVSQQRKRDAIERVAPLTMDKDGQRVGLLPALVESERLRQEIGRIPVPLGYCVEPHNVKALGAHCPFSHQCLGCDNFRTDPSFLPDLYVYLERLLETRERLRLAVPQLAEWARVKAIPADGEIKAVRNLIRAGEAGLDELSVDERRKLEELCRVLRAQRARLDDTVPIELIGQTQQPEPTFVPVLPAAAGGDVG
jgi:integrase